MTKVKTISRTADKSCNCGSWLQHWENFCGSKAILCSSILCLEGQLVGAHVKKIYLTDSAQYIIPLCQQHNQSENMIEISDNCILVSADPKETCGKAK
ncbi:MAG: hypothetical protein ABFS32_08140 [Bacteroidota bacterium]